MDSEAFEILSRKWHPYIIRHLTEKGGSSFSSIKSDIDGISSKALSDSLEDLEGKNLIEHSEEKYRLTDKGREMNRILEAAHSWEERFSGDQDILVAEDDREQAELYSRWLEEEYTALRARKKSGFYSHLERDPAAIIMDRDLENTSAGELIDEIDAEIPVVVVTGKEPSESELGRKVEKYLIKPVSKDQLKKAVKESIQASEKGEKRTELMRLLAEMKMVKREGENPEKYRELEKKVEQLREELEIPQKSISEFFSG